MNKDSNMKYEVLAKLPFDDYDSVVKCNTDLASLIAIGIYELSLGSYVIVERHFSNRLNCWYGVNHEKSLFTGLS